MNKLYFALWCFVDLLLLTLLVFNIVEIYDFNVSDSVELVDCYDANNNIIRGVVCEDTHNEELQGLSASFALLLLFFVILSMFLVVIFNAEGLE